MKVFILFLVVVVVVASRDETSDKETLLPQEMELGNTSLTGNLGIDAGKPFAGLGITHKSRDGRLVIGGGFKTGVGQKPSYNLKVTFKFGKRRR